MKGQSYHDRKGSDDGTKAGTEYKVYINSEMASKTDATHGDSKAERKKKKSSKKRKSLEEFQGALDGD